ncbi:MAG: iron-sulfur cluster repair di-iron protein [Bacteroidota bacterium]
MEILDEKTIGAIVTDDYRTASVFEKYHIDFCCNGNRPLSEVCEQQGLDSSIIANELVESTQQNKTQNLNYNSWPLDLLANYIEKKHHTYVEEQISVLKGYLQKIEGVHAHRHPELFKIRGLFELSAGQLSMHMKKEELVLFPFIRKLSNAKKSGLKLDTPIFGTVENPIATMMREHDDEGESFKEIAKLSNNYTPPSDACTTYIVAYKVLKEFQDDLHLHIHLENNILFPKAVELEKELM